MDSKAGNGPSVSIPIKGRGIHPSALLAFASVFLAGLASCGTTYPHDTASAIATASYPGKGVLYKCSPYADALFDALKANNIEAWKVYYMGGYWEKTNYHVMVVYKDAGELLVCRQYISIPDPFMGKNSTRMRARPR